MSVTPIGGGIVSNLAPDQVAYVRLVLPLLYGADDWNRDRWRGVVCNPGASFTRALLTLHRIGRTPDDAAAVIRNLADSARTGPPAVADPDTVYENWIHRVEYLEGLTDNHNLDAERAAAYEGEWSSAAAAAASELATDFWGGSQFRSH